MNVLTGFYSVLFVDQDVKQLVVQMMLSHQHGDSVFVGFVYIDFELIASKLKVAVEIPGDLIPDSCFDYIAVCFC